MNMDQPIRGQDANLDERIKGIFGEFAIFQQDLPFHAEALAQVTVIAFNNCVHWLRTPENITNQEVNALAGMMWTLIEKKIVATAMHNGVPHLTFAVIENRTNGVQTPVLLIPPNFVKQVQTNPLKELGSFVFYSRQIAGFIRDEIDGSEEKRKELEIESYKLEASFLESVFQQYPAVEPSEYHQKVMAFGRGEITYDEFRS